MNVYGGYIDLQGNALVSKNGDVLPLQRSLLVRSHSPTGFSWGYCGSGPAQLALAILLEELYYGQALELYQDFKREVIAGFSNEPLIIWRLTGEEIRDWAYRRLAVLEVQQFDRN